MLPSARRVAVLANETDPYTRPFLEQIGQSARSLDLTIEPVMARPTSPLEAAFAAMSDKHIDALIVQGSMVRNDVFDLAIKHRLPSFSSFRQVATAGGLMSYAASSAEVYGAAARYVDEILKGRKPADLPVAEPTKFELVINLKTAQALGIVISPALLARADEVIE